MKRNHRVCVTLALTWHRWRIVGRLTAARRELVHATKHELGALVVLRRVQVVAGELVILRNRFSLPVDNLVSKVQFFLNFDDSKNTNQIRILFVLKKKP